MYDSLVLQVPICCFKNLENFFVMYVKVQRSSAPEGLIVFEVFLTLTQQIAKCVHLLAYIILLQK